MWTKTISLALVGIAPLAGCDLLPGKAQPRDADMPSAAFPAASRPVSQTVSSRWSTEVERDQVKEADRAMDLAGVAPGMSVADIGAGEGYYTIRLAARVGKKGRVLAQDIFPEVRSKLAERVYRDKLDNVSVTLGAATDPKLPANSFDRIFMMHMYHEVAAPYEFLWRLRPALRKTGRIVVVDIDRPTGNHGIPPATLKCELEAIGFRLTGQQPMPQKGVYLAMFERVGTRPAPSSIKVCKG